MDGVAQYLAAPGPLHLLLRSAAAGGVDDGDWNPVTAPKVEHEPGKCARQRWRWTMMQLPCTCTESWKRAQRPQPEGRHVVVPLPAHTGQYFYVYDGNHFGVPVSDEKFKDDVAWQMLNDPAYKIGVRSVSFR